MAKVFLSIGSNMGDRLSNIQHAVRLLSFDENISIKNTSAFYETEPWGGVASDWFVNCAIEITTVLSPIELLRVCQDVEAQLGRNREQEIHWGSRPLDIDVLFYDDLILEKEILTIPHPHLHNRAFVLVPLLEIASEFIHPIFHKTIEEIYSELENPEGVFLYGTIESDKYEN